MYSSNKIILFHPIGKTTPVKPQLSVEISYGHDVQRSPHEPKDEKEWWFYDIDSTKPCQLCEIAPIKDCSYMQHRPSPTHEYDPEFHNVENSCGKCHENYIQYAEDYRHHHWLCDDRTAKNWEEYVYNTVITYRKAKDAVKVKEEKKVRWDIRITHTMYKSSVFSFRWTRKKSVLSTRAKQIEEIQKKEENPK